MYNVDTSGAIVRSLDGAAPELSAQRWREFDGAEDALLYRSIVLAQAAALENELFVACVRTEGRLSGLAIAMMSADPERPALIVVVPNVLRRRGPTGLWVHPADDPQSVRQRLLEALRAFAKECRIPRIVVGSSATEDEPLRRAAAASGFREFTANPHYELRLPAGGHAAYLATLSHKRRWNVLEDFRQSERAAAVFAVDADPADTDLERAWKLQLDAFERKGERVLAWRRNMFCCLKEHLPPSSLSMVWCRRGDEGLGFCLSLLMAHETLCVNAAHVPSCDFYVHMACVAKTVQREAERGTRVVLLGPTNDTFKQRIGAVAVPHSYYYAHDD